MGTINAYKHIDDLGFHCYSGADGDLYRTAGLPGWRISLSAHSYRIQEKTPHGWTTTGCVIDRTDNVAVTLFLDAIQYLLDHGTVPEWIPHDCGRCKGTGRIIVNGTGPTYPRERDCHRCDGIGGHDNA